MSRPVKSAQEVALGMAKAIYWAAYERKDHPHPCGFDRETAWAKASEVQREMNMRQAIAAMQEVASYAP